MLTDVRKQHDEEGEDEVAEGAKWFVIQALNEVVCKLALKRNNSKLFYLLQFIGPAKFDSVVSNLKVSSLHIHITLRRIIDKELRVAQQQVTYDMKFTSASLTSLGQKTTEKKCESGVEMNISQLTQTQTVQWVQQESKTEKS